MEIVFLVVICRLGLNVSFFSGIKSVRVFFRVLFHQVGVRSVASVDGIIIVV